MDRTKDPSRARTRRRRRISLFLRRNALFIAAILCLAALGGVSAFLLSGRSGEAPAGRSGDERLSEAERTNPPHEEVLTARPTEAEPAAPTPGPSPKPTVIPDMTVRPIETPPPEGTTQWNSPVKGRLIRSYAMDHLIYSKTLGQWMTHRGVDIAAPIGTEVRSIEAGTVQSVYDDDMLGTTVIIAHEGGVSSVYSGLKKDPPVKEGDAVEARGLIGYVGDTAISECSEESHLHFELLLNDIPVDPRMCVLFAEDE
ncbi:MAG: peptidoglycan DD-metalloendopeptidase family protein [Clostridia bacterium]|nr:peptidoglycan DD-metalloendopeptidase family protein [Clostridia bacterium]